MALLIAALCAEGTSTIGNVGEIDRGYERIDERLRASARRSSASRPSHGDGARRSSRRPHAAMRA